MLGFDSVVFGFFHPFWLLGEDLGEFEEGLRIIFVEIGVLQSVVGEEAKKEFWDVFVRAFLEFDFLKDLDIVFGRLFVFYLWIFLLFWIFFDRADRLDQFFKIFFIAIIIIIITLILTFWVFFDGFLFHIVDHG